MSSPARNSYLATEVLTAPPQKLHLMLVEGALRFAQRAREHWRAGQPEHAAEALLRAEDILGELMAGLNRDVDSNLVNKTAAVYLFIFRSLTEANLRKDQGKLDDAIRVLTIQRDTWREICQRLGATGASHAEDVDAVSLDSTKATPPRSVPPLPCRSPAASEPSGRFSLDA
jgi:flagellar protein FliS